MHAHRPPARTIVGAIAPLLLLPAACTINFDPGDLDDLLGDDFTTTVTVTSGGGDPNGVTVRVVNNTAGTLDPQIYVTGAAVTDPSQLFSAGNLYTRYGVGNRGLLGDFDTDSFVLTCSEARVIGTPGGLFGDDLEDPDGVGQQRILGQDVAFSCGDTITFTYSR